MLPATMIRPPGEHTMTAYLEHANLHVSDVDGMLDFIRTALPDFRVRFDSGADDPERWVHVGDDQTYLALYRASLPRTQAADPYNGEPQLNHLGFVVEDVDAVRQRLLAKGYRDSTLPNRHPARKRLYFRDAENNEWEFVEYLSRTHDERNDYKS
jgi:catechol 2,3-dioxygenase-like lactoylglutathione lyase family enzyme